MGVKKTIPKKSIFILRKFCVVLHTLLFLGVLANLQTLAYGGLFWFYSLFMIIAFQASAITMMLP